MWVRHRGRGYQLDRCKGLGASRRPGMNENVWEFWGPVAAAL